jgi:hypothetical protein
MLGSKVINAVEGGLLNLELKEIRNAKQQTEENVRP